MFKFVETPLTKAAENGYMEAVTLLVSNGARFPRSFGKKMQSMIHNHSLMVKFILDNNLIDIEDISILGCILMSFKAKDSELSFMLFKYVDRIEQIYHGSANLLSFAESFRPNEDVMEFLESKMKPFKAKN